jgi:hypothetical protein
LDFFRRENDRSAVPTTSQAQLQQPDQSALNRQTNISRLKSTTNISRIAGSESTVHANILAVTNPDVDVNQRIQSTEAVKSSKKAVVHPGDRQKEGHRGTESDSESSSSEDLGPTQIQTDEGQESSNGAASAANSRSLNQLAQLGESEDDEDAIWAQRRREKAQSLQLQRQLKTNNKRAQQSLHDQPQVQLAVETETLPQRQSTKPSPTLKLANTAVDMNDVNQLTYKQRIEREIRLENENPRGQLKEGTSVQQITDTNADFYVDTHEAPDQSPANDKSSVISKPSNNVIPETTRRPTLPVLQSPPAADSIDAFVVAQDSNVLNSFLNAGAGSPKHTVSVSNNSTRGKISEPKKPLASSESDSDGGGLGNKKKSRGGPKPGLRRAVTKKPSVSASEGAKVDAAGTAAAAASQVSEPSYTSEKAEWRTSAVDGTNIDSKGLSYGRPSEPTMALNHTDETIASQNSIVASGQLCDNTEELHCRTIASPPPPPPPTPALHSESVITSPGQQQTCISPTSTQIAATAAVERSPDQVEAVARVEFMASQINEALLAHQTTARRSENESDEDEGAGISSTIIGGKATSLTSKPGGLRRAGKKSQTNSVTTTSVSQMPQLTDVNNSSVDGASRALDEEHHGKGLNHAKDANDGHRGEYVNVPPPCEPPSSSSRSSLTMSPVDGTDESYNPPTQMSVASSNLNFSPTQLLQQIAGQQSPDSVISEDTGSEQRAQLLNVDIDATLLGQRESRLEAGTPTITDPLDSIDDEHHGTFKQSIGTAAVHRRVDHPNVPAPCEPAPTPAATPALEDSTDLVSIASSNLEFSPTELAERIGRQQSPDSDCYVVDLEAPGIMTPPPVVTGTPSIDPPSTLDAEHHGSFIRDEGHSSGQRVAHANVPLPWEPPLSAPTTPCLMDVKPSPPPSLAVSAQRMLTAEDSPCVLPAILREDRTPINLADVGGERPEDDEADDDDAFQRVSANHVLPAILREDVLSINLDDIGGERPENDDGGDAVALVSREPHNSIGNRSSGGLDAVNDAVFEPKCHPSVKDGEPVKPSEPSSAGGPRTVSGTDATAAKPVVLRRKKDDTQKVKFSSRPQQRFADDSDGDEDTVDKSGNSSSSKKFIDLDDEEETFCSSKGVGGLNARKGR